MVENVLKAESINSKTGLYPTEYADGVEDWTISNMPGVRRSVSRSQSTPPPTLGATKVNKPGDPSVGTNDDTERLLGVNPPSPPVILPPKHAHVPDLPADSTVLFEAMVFMFGTMALSLQYINLYKTVWWLPHSHSNYALNFYLIDPYLVMFLIASMSRRLVFSFWSESCRPRRSCMYWAVQVVRSVLVMCLVTVWGWAGYHVVLRQSLLYSLFLCYPLFCYVLLFGCNVKPLFGKALMTQRVPSEKDTTKTKAKDLKPHDLLHHDCFTCPEAIRDEVDTLKTDFNRRIKEVLFNSMVVTYYVGFIPVCFAQNTLYYDIWWVAQHVVLVWLSAFIVFSIHYLPVKYVDVMHCCALHLGKWTKVEGRHAHVPHNAWSELQVWPRGVLVKHVRGLFKAEGINNSAEPGNGMHTRFYFLFHKPLRVTHWLLMLTGVLVAYQLILLVQWSEWNRVLSIVFLLFSNYYMLFKLMRDYFVLTKVYKDEK